MGNLDKIAVMDIETVIDPNDVEEGYDYSKFAAPLKHEIISLALIDITRHSESFEVKKICHAKGPERDICARFARFMDMSSPQIVTANGRTFDLPVIINRSFKHGVPQKCLFESKKRNKWENYTHRYSESFHCDVMDGLTNFGAGKPAKLGVTAASIGLPGKIGVDGSDVAGMYAAGKIDEIADYCELDVMNTYGVYLRYMFVTAQISLEFYHKSVDNFFEYIIKYSEEKRHFREFLHHTNLAKFRLDETSVEDKFVSHTPRSIIYQKNLNGEIV